MFDRAGLQCEKFMHILCVISWNHIIPLLCVTAQVGFYGMDIYSLASSTHSVIEYLQKIDSQAAEAARKRYSCFDRYVMMDTLFRARSLGWDTV